MSNYVKSTNFTAKDSLPTGDANKVIRGSEFDTEFNSLQVASATKADLLSPTFTGTATFDNITATGTVNITGSGLSITFSQLDPEAVTLSSETFSDVDNQLPTNAAVIDYVAATIPTIAEVNDLSEVVTWTTVPDEYISASSVNQHVAAVEKATQTKTYAKGEASTITLSEAITSGAPVVSVIKEVPQSGATNNDWDAAADSYTIEDSAYDTSLIINGYNFNKTILLNNFNVTAQETDPWSVTFSTDGTNMYVGGDNTKFYQYTLSTPFDVSTAVFLQEITSTDNGSHGLVFSPDGTKLLALGNVARKVGQWELSTAWDISTAVNTGKYDVVSQTSSPRGLALSPDGTKMFVTGAGKVFQYTLSAAFDITSTVTYQASYTVSSQENDPKGIAFTNDGTRMFICGNASNQLHEYVLLTPFDISAVVAYIGVVLNLGSQDSSPEDIYLLPDRFYMLGNNGGKVFSYSLGISSLELGSGSFDAADIGKTIFINDGELVLVSTDGSSAIKESISSYETAASGEWRMQDLIYNSNEDHIEISGISDLTSSSFIDSVGVTTQPYGVVLSPDGFKMFTVDQGAQALYEYDLSTAFDVTTRTLLRNLSVSAQDTYPRGLTFSTDGTKVFVVGGTNKTVYQYTLPSSFSLDGAVYAGLKLISSEETQPLGIQFNTDGTKMFIVGGSRKVRSYTLPTGFNIVTAVYDSIEFNFQTQESNPKDIAFSQDGKKMFMVGSSSKAVYEYDLTTAFNLSTVSYSGKSFSVASQDSTPTGITFSTKQNLMFICGYSGKKVYSYNFGAFSSGYKPTFAKKIDSTYWIDINSTTATSTGEVYYAVSNDARDSWSVLDNTSGTRDIVRNNAGTWQYNSNTTYASETWVNATVNNEVQALRDSMSISINQMDSTKLNAITDANQITLGDDLDFVAILRISSDSTGPTYSGTSVNYDANIVNQAAVLGTDYSWDFPTSTSVRLTSLGDYNLKVRII